MLFTKNLKNVKFKKKLFYKFTKSFKVIDVVDTQAYHLKFSKQWKIYFVFHVFLLKFYHTNSNVVASNKIIFVNENEKWKVKNILKNKKKWRKFYYFVRWKNFFFAKTIEYLNTIWRMRRNYLSNIINAKHRTLSYQRRKSSD